MIVLSRSCLGSYNPLLRYSRVGRPFCTANRHGLHKTGSTRGSVRARNIRHVTIIGNLVIDNCVFRTVQIEYCVLYLPLAVWEEAIIVNVFMVGTNTANQFFWWKLQLCVCLPSVAAAAAAFRNPVANSFSPLLDRTPRSFRAWSAPDDAEGDQNTTTRVFRVFAFY